MMAAEMLREPPVESHELLSDVVELALVRARRWEALRATFPTVRSDVIDWAQKMTVKHKRATVRVWNNITTWITALYIVRYGENEAYWPEELTNEDVKRAERWLAGELPQGVRYLDAEV
jgi:hypothetical protein